MVDATTGHEALSFMGRIFRLQSNSDGSKRRGKDSLPCTPKGIFCYKVMPFGAKNAGATYQRAMQKIFDDFLHKFVECYVGDVVVKTKSRGDHLRDLRAVFERLRRHQLKMNPLKRAFGDFVRIKKPSGASAYIRAVHLKSGGRCQPFNHLMKKDTPAEWNESCRRAFQNIKNYLMRPLVLMAPTSGKPLLLYIAAQEKSLGALLAQNDDQGKERPLYYLSRTMVGAELNYSPIEKTCLALIFAIQKLRHYLLANSTNLISRADPLKFIMSRPMLFGRLAKWALLLSRVRDQFHPSRESHLRTRTCKFPSRSSHPSRVGEEEETNLVSVYAIEEEDWRQQFLDYLEHNKFPEELKARVYVRRVAPKFCLFNNTLYRRSYDGILLRCVSKEEGQAILAEAHGGICGAHQAGPKLHLQVKQLGYYWPTIFAGRDRIGKTPRGMSITRQLHPSASQPFTSNGGLRPLKLWGMDIIGPINPKSSANHPIYLAATELFFLSGQKQQLIKKSKLPPWSISFGHKSYRYGVPRYIMTDNGTPFRNKTMDNLREKFSIKRRASTAYNPAANGLAEAFNKTLCKILKKTVARK
ncbi:hypothetical protein H6P81_006029 [Aristolochia fimbriata]|uniref:Integrase catalytic domain-containing protein n=1 Tax=Aristolochia fimbriata TaxID=158543 RepID=A0AAV7EW79_ARIFI|nr:hypothetical protein H6P81_006029 [Aristolochia fimbriata]